MPWLIATTVYLWDRKEAGERCPRCGVIICWEQRGALRMRSGVCGAFCRFLHLGPA
jgi:hypothetical protein